MTSAAETEHVLDLARRFPNIHDVFMDGFFRGARPCISTSGITASRRLHLLRAAVRGAFPDNG